MRKQAGDWNWGAFPLTSLGTKHMDLNYILQREQVERTRADQAGSGAAAEAHRGLAALYRQQIESYRSANQGHAQNRR